MSEEKEAELRYVKLEWSDGTVESIYVSFGVNALTIDLTAKKRWGDLK